MLTQTHGLHEVRWWIFSLTGLALILGAFVLHALSPETNSDHFTLAVMALGGGLAGVKTLKDATGFARREGRARRRQRDTEEREVQRQQQEP